MKRALNRNKNRFKWNKWTWVVCTTVVVCIAGAFCAGRISASAASGSSVITGKSYSVLKPVAGLHRETVLLIGGSMAYGWKDPTNDSYIERAFTGLSGSTTTQYTYINRALVGASAKNYTAKHMQDYLTALSNLQPSVVIISWGLLNDIAQKTTKEVFEAAIRTQITAAVDAHAVVLLVSPAVVRANYTYAKDKTTKYVSWEKEVAKSFDSPDVRVIDIYAQMMQYLAVHNQTYAPYFGDNWHPNEAGHILAGNMLENDIVAEFGQAPLRYVKKSVQKGSR